jgi:electron transfer flavoprotein beta subunit
MKICVLVKEVPDAAVEKKINPSTGRMDRSGEKNLNPYDTHAIEAAMQIKEGGTVPVEEIVAVTMGPESAVRALHKAVSLGADRSVHLSDEVVAGSDVAATGYALAKTLQRESQAEYGYDTVQIKLPAVISVGDAINEPRYPSLKAIMGAKKKPLDSVSAAEVEIDASKVGGDNSAAQWVAAKAPPAKAAGEIIEDEDTNETVEKIVAWLDERKLI